MENEKVSDLLNRFGLIKNDTSVYLAILKIGKSYAGEIIAESKLHSSRVHESLHRLINLGLVSYVIQANKKIYQAENPERLLKIAEELEKEIKDILPNLLEIHRKKDDEINAKIYEGYKGLRTLFDFVLEELKPKDEHLVFSAVKEPEHFVAYFNHWNERRIKKKIKMRIAFNEDAKEQILETTKRKLVKYKVLPKEFNSPAVINIFKDNVAIVLWTKTPIAFLIKSKEASISFRQYFELLWGVAKP